MLRPKEAGCKDELKTKTQQTEATLGSFPKRDCAPLQTRMLRKGNKCWQCSDACQTVKRFDLTLESSASKQHDLLQLVFQFHHQSQKGPIFVHRDIATSNETLYQVDPLVDVVDDLSKTFSKRCCCSNTHTHCDHLQASCYFRLKASRI